MMPLPLIVRLPSGQKSSGIPESFTAASDSCTDMGKLVLSILDAVLMVSPAAWSTPVNSLLITLLPDPGRFDRQL